MDEVGADLRYACRQLGQSPAFTAVAILSLALGIGANTAVFSLINAVMLRELPVREPQQLVELLSRYPGDPPYNGFSWTVYERLRDQSHVFADLFGLSYARFQATGERFDAAPLDGAYVVGSFFPARLNTEGSGYNRSQLTTLYRELLERLQAIPGVRSVTLSAVTPIEGPGAASFARVEGSRQSPEDRRYLSINMVGPRYFETLGTPWIAGRDFQFEDAARPRVAIVNQAMARSYFGDGSPLGKHVTFDGDDMPYDIVGVAGDAKYLTLHKAAPPTVYLNAFQEGRIVSQFALRTRVPSSGRHKRYEACRCRRVAERPSGEGHDDERSSGCVDHPRAVDRDAVRLFRRAGDAARGDRPLRPPRIRGGAPHE
jgi:MacB-like periplasmic core domain